MGNEVFELRTNAKLLTELHFALSKKQSAQDILEQRVSFVFGSLGSDSSVTRDRIRQVIVQQDGVAA